MSKSGDWIGVGDVISIEAPSSCFCGKGEISISSGAGQGDDDTGRGGVVIDSGHQRQYIAEHVQL